MRRTINFKKEHSPTFTSSVHLHTYVKKLQSEISVDSNIIYLGRVLLAYMCAYSRSSTGCPKKNWTLTLVGHNSKNN